MLRLQLNIDGSFLFSQEIDEEEMIANDNNIKTRVPVNEEIIEAYVAEMKMMFYKQILKAESYEIILVIESKMKCERTKELAECWN